MTKPSNFWRPWFVVAALGLSLLSFAQTSQPRPLVPGQTYEGSVNDAAPLVFALPLQADAYLNLTVSFQGQSLDVSLTNASGQTVAERRANAETTDSAEIAFIAPAAELYRLNLRRRSASADSSATAASRYKIEIKTLRPATEQDRQFLQAYRLNEEGLALSLQRTAASRRQALAKYRAALPLWQANGALTQELETLRLIADLQFVLGEFRPALTSAEEMLAKARAAGLRLQELKGLKYVGALQSSLNENLAAQQTLEQALKLSRALRERLEERAILNSLGIATAALGQRHAAIEYYREALSIAREIGDRSGEATMLRNLAVRYESIGELDQALAHYQQALTLRRALGLRDSEALTLLDLARVQLRLGELQPARDLTEQALTQLRAAGRKDDEASAIFQRGRIHYQMRELELARQDVQQALELYRGNNNRRQLATCLRWLSLLQRQQGQPAETLRLLQEALTLHRALNTPTDIMSDLLQLGVEYTEQGTPQQALAPLTEALNLSRQLTSVFGEAQALFHLSRAQRAAGATEQAHSLLQQALPLSQKCKARALEAEINHDLALFSLRRSQFAEAQTQIETALAIIETARQGLVNPANRAEFRSNRQSYYELYITALLERAAQEGNTTLAAQALAASERSRARSLLDLLTEAQFDLRQGVNADLLNRERSLQQRLLAKAELVQQASGSKTGQEQAQRLETEIATLTAELREVEAEIRRTSPAYAALVQPQPLALAELQRQVLDQDTALLEYALGAERSYVFLVTAQTLQVFPLPQRAEIETQARQFYEKLTAYSQSPVFSSIAEKQAWLQRLGRASEQAAAELSRLLIQPVAASLTGKPRLLIVPDGLLHYVPFAALPVSHTRSATPTTANRAKPGRRPASVRQATSSSNSQPLIVQHEILTLPSASTLAILRQTNAGRALASKTLALFADPVYHQQDERLRPVATTPLLTAAAPTTRGTVLKLERLPATRSEAEFISQLVPASERRIALGFDANRAAATDPSLSQYRYVHFATHGLLDVTHPELSGLALTQLDAQGLPQAGFLHTFDVFKLRLNAELVVLSGCQTGLGKEVQGEGLIGLTRGFMYAGTRRVLASLWQVNDVATAELMKRFYQGLLGPQRLSPAAALRAAQLALWRTPRWQAPHWWAAFALQGEW